MNDGFVFYASFYDALSDLPDDIRVQAYDAICRYALLGEEPDCGGVVRTVFKLVKPQIDANNKRREAGRKGGQAYRKHDASTEEAKTRRQEANVSKQEPKEKEKVKVKEKENVKESKRFAPPSLEEVAGYCFDRNNSVDPQRFVDFYSSKGWKVGNSPMKDWKAAVRTWERREDKRQDQKPVIKKNAFTRFDQREYAEDDLELQLLEGVRR